MSTEYQLNINQLNLTVGKLGGDAQGEGVAAELGKDPAELPPARSHLVRQSTGQPAGHVGR